MSQQSPYKRILFAPHEIGGQMQLMVEELRRRGHYATAASYTQEWFGHVNDINLHMDRRSRAGKHASAVLFTVWAASNYDVFHFFWGRSLFGLRNRPHLDLPLLRRLGKKVFVHFRGLDLIDIKHFDYLRAMTAGDDVEEPALSRPDQLRSLRAWRRHAHGLLVSEPDLFRVADDAVMVQQAIDLKEWQSSGSARSQDDTGAIRIAHAPSMRRKKGTEFVEQSVEELRAMGYQIELILIEKKPYHEVKQLYERCDIGIDQVLYGWYGKVSIELMALGKPVVCYVRDEWRIYRPDMPIVSAEPKDLTARLKELCGSTERRRELGRLGIEYVKRHHDVGLVIDQCLDLYAAAYNSKAAAGSPPLRRKSSEQRHRNV